MCLATPIQVEKITPDNKAIVHANGKEKKIDLSLIKNVKAGDWLLCHDDLAINTLDPEEAQKILQLVDSCPHDHQH